MALYELNPTLETLHGHFAADLPPILQIASGDTVRYRTIDAGWHQFAQEQPYTMAADFPGRDKQMNSGHAILGPVAIEGAKAGMTLELRLDTIRPGSWGWVSSGYPTPRNEQLGLVGAEPQTIVWQLDAAAGFATNQRGQRVALKPFMGLMGMPPAEPGSHPTPPPRFTGGNIDCKELVAGSRLFLPIAVDGGLFSLGDGHACQGDGEVAGPALECPMECVEVTFILHPELSISMPYAETPAGHITFGFAEDIEAAMFTALNAMVDHLQATYSVPRTEAVTLASLVVDLHITQIVNGVRGVHAILPHNAILGAA